LTSIVARGMETEQRVPYLAYFNTLPRGSAAKIAINLGMPDVYSPEFAQYLEESAKLSSRRARTILAGRLLHRQRAALAAPRIGSSRHVSGRSATAMQSEIKRFLAQGDTPNGAASSWSRRSISISPWWPRHSRSTTPITSTWAFALRQPSRLYFQGRACLRCLQLEYLRVRTYQAGQDRIRALRAPCDYRRVSFGVRRMASAPAWFRCAIRKSAE